VPKKSKSKNNVVKLVKRAAPKSNNITLDKDPSGNNITNLDHYKAKDLERMFTIDDVCLLIPQYIKKRTWCEWRELNRGKPREVRVGPEYVLLGFKKYRIKLIWILRYIKGLPWEPEVQVQVSATQSDEMQLRSSKSF